MIAKNQKNKLKTAPKNPMELKYEHSHFCLPKELPLS